MAKICKRHTYSAAETESLAEIIGRNLRGGEILELVSDLGGGKTTFVRGLARGFGSQDRVSSPTFTISQVYKAGNKEIHHYDFYRLQEAGIVGAELREDIGAPDVISVIEWGEIVQDALPSHMKIEIKRTGEESRQITFSFPETYSYLLVGVAA